MSFAAPSAFLLLAPLALLLAWSRAPRFGAAVRLPGAWAKVVAPSFRAIVAAQAQNAAARPVLSGAIAALLIAALARPGVDLAEPEAFASLGGRVVVVDVGADLVRHRQFIDALNRASPTTPTAVVAVAGDAYRVTPFTTDQAHVARYVRVLSADMMPRAGQKPHLGLALAERLLEDGGFPVRQIVFLSARRAPEDAVVAPLQSSRRIVVDLAETGDWRGWAEAQGAELAPRSAVGALAEDLRGETRELARAELPEAAMELKPGLVALAAALLLLMFRRRAA